MDDQLSLDWSRRATAFSFADIAHGLVVPQMSNFLLIRKEMS